MENGITFNKNNPSNQSLVIPTSLWKLGVNDKLELRMITDPKLINLENNAEFALPPVLFGFKTRLVNEKGLIPNISFIGHVSNPFLSTDNSRGSNFTPDFRFTLDNTLSKRMSLGYNIGMKWEDGNAEPIFQYTSALGYLIDDKWKCYIELYGDKPQNGAFQLSTTAGLYYFPVPNVMLDITAAYGLANTDLNYYTALGFSFLVPVKATKTSNK